MHNATTSLGAQPTMVAGRPVSFYRSPLDRPDFLWCALPDLLGVVEFSPDAASHWAKLWIDAHPEQARIMPDGTGIVPDHVALGLFEWARMSGWAPAEEVQRAYAAASGELLVQLHAGMSGAEFRSYLQRASLENMPIGGDGHVH